MIDRIQDVWGPRTPHPRGTEWPVRVDVRLDDGLTEADVERWVRSACVLCSNGCGLEIAVLGGRMVGVRGTATDAVNHGRLGPKGLYGSTPWATSPDRLTTPLVRENGELREATWDEAMARIVAKSRDVLERKGPLGVGFYTSGQLFLEEYYTLAVIGKAVTDGDLVRVESRRGAIVAPARIERTRPRRGHRLRAVPLRLLGRGRGLSFPATVSARGPPTS